MATTSYNVSQPRDYKLIVEKDVKIPMRDGAVLYADVLRPEGGAERFPAIMTIGPYQKDRLWIPPADLGEKANPYLAWETGNPLWWCPRGYALVRVDARGSGKSPGPSDPNSYAEAVDFYDAIEWVAKLPWCSGNIGTLGVSYHANCQWRVAKLQPPSLKAIIPWEGRADLYRDQTFHGGIFAMGFLHTWLATNMAHHLMGRARSYNPGAFNNNMLWNWANNSLDSEYWRLRSADWEKTVVPFYSVGNWTGMGLHLRGNIEAFMHAASWHKKLRIHSGTHFHPFHSEEGRMDQLRFFDHWLKGIDTGIMNEPPVKLMIRTGISFMTAPLTEDTEVTGPIVLALWVSSSSEDMDIFATLRNIGPDGKDVWEDGQQGGGDYVPVAKGWLRASHRKLDPQRSLPYRPYHAHDERQWLKPGEIVECHVEIWPTSMVFKKGHRIRLDVQPRDGVGSSVYRHYHADYNIGAENTIHAGGDKVSYLLLPLIPPK